MVESEARLLGYNRPLFVEAVDLTDYDQGVEKYGEEEHA